MNRITTSLAAALVGAITLGVFPASAADVRAELTPDLIYDHCLAAGVGSETEGTFMLSGGRRVSGTLLCTAEDLVAPKGRPSSQDDEDDDDEHDNGDYDD